MSIAKLNKIERGTYFVGKAVAATMERIEKSTDPKMEQAKSMIFVFLKVNSSPEALAAIREPHGWFVRFEERAASIAETYKTRDSGELN